mmetsp:Transcript_23668/g.66453  ORF Transcript_23668/g.66453 Transcript_23668/m.66453 type:complete len:223 (-) Transcript_23668:827-1495(-)
MNAVSRARSRQTGHSSVPLERSGAGSACGGKLLLPDVLKAPPSAASMPGSGWESRSGCAALFLSSARRPGVGAGADSCAETPCDHSPPVALTRNEYAPPASSPLTRALLLRTVAKFCQAPPVLRHCTSKLCAEPCSHASVTSVCATLSIFRPRSVRPAGAAAAGRAPPNGGNEHPRRRYGADAGATEPSAWNSKSSGRLPPCLRCSSCIRAGWLCRFTTKSV